MTLESISLQNNASKVRKTWYVSFCAFWSTCQERVYTPHTVADLGGGWGGCKVTILAEKSASISNNSAPVRDASPPPA